MSSNQKNVTIPVYIVTGVIILLSVLLACFGGKIDYQFDEASFTINAKGWKGMTVSYADIESIEMQDDVDFGRRTMGFGSRSCKFGSFRNAEFGDYTLYAFSGCTKLVVLHLKDCSILALNDETDEATDALFAELNSRL